MKSSREIKSSLDVARERRAPSMISLLEAKIKKELEDEFGPILTEREKAMIIDRERKNRRARDSAVKKARMKLLKQKEKALLTWRIRSSDQEKTSSSSSTVQANADTADGEGDERHEVVLEY